MMLVPLGGNAFLRYTPVNFVQVLREKDMNQWRANELGEMERGVRPASRLEHSVVVHPQLVSPTCSALYFIHTDYVAKLLLMGVSINAPCALADACAGNCKFAIASFIQDKVGRDPATVIGGYLVGKGWPGWVDKEPPRTWRTVREWFER